MRASFFITCVVAAGVHLAAKGDVGYQIQRVGPTTGEISAYCINDQALMGGNGWIGTPSSVQLLPGTFYGVNNAGIAVGYEGQSGIHPIIHGPNGLTTLVGFTGNAQDINSSGAIVGGGYPKPIASGGYNQGFQYQGTSFTMLNTLGGNETEAYGINDSGVIVGRSRIASGLWQAFSWDNGTMTSLGALTPGGKSAAYDINSTGEIVGSASTTDGGIDAVVFSQGQVTDLGALPSYKYTEANAINNSGTIVGFGFSDSLQERAFVSQGIGLTDLNTLIDPASGWTVEEAWDDNDLGQIVGDGTFLDPSNPNAQPVHTAFLLTPISNGAAVIPEPGATGLLILSLGMYLQSRSSRRWLKSPASSGS